MILPELSRGDLIDASERGTKEVFVVDMSLPDGRRYVTSVSTPSGVSAARNRFGATGGTVSNWRRDKLVRDDIHCFYDWRLNERYAL